MNRANKTLCCWEEAVAVTTAIQEEIFLEMGIDPRFGLLCLGKVNINYENDQDMMIRFYKFIAREEMACDEAELGADEFAERMQLDSRKQMQEQQLEMLKHMRRFPLDDQSAILEKLRQPMEIADFEDAASELSSEQIQEIVRRRVSRVYLTPSIMHHLSNVAGSSWPLIPVVVVCTLL
ncbi:hypothetical protein RchiOBHm_Chr2g0175681 [Rosa chinensis]|uniref:Uncharacterized protein n=1 Tax=Rosa chinensis TaxID=74649 RepID=A0A2P6S6H9_ROSCH|nr:hypothetical protein RchiOBHm_Chr2g0175681 [Rosa chinensis]